MAGIGEYNQTDLHEQLKDIYRGSSGMTEVEVDGFVVDVRLPNEIVEIQTRHLGKLRRKILGLRADHSIRIVHPIPALTHLVKLSESGELLSSRRSPRRGRLEDAFREITTVADLLLHPNVHLDLVLVEITEFRRDDGKGSWRRRGVSIVGRKLERVVETRTFSNASDYLAVLPADTPPRFTNAELAERTGLRYTRIQPLTSALRKMGIISIVDKKGQAIVYSVAHTPHARNSSTSRAKSG